MGVASAIAAGVLSWPLIRDALTHPIPITLAVFASGLVFKWTRRYIGDALVRLRLIIPMRVMLAVLVVALALLSSVITVIIASLVLVELISALRFEKEDESRLLVTAFLAIGLAASLPPIRELPSTIPAAKP